MNKWRAEAEGPITEAAGEEGQAVAEYTVILAMIFAVCVATLALMGPPITAAVDAVVAAIP